MMDKQQADKLAKKLVDKNPKLRALKSISNGEKPLYGASEAGKGSAPRTNTNSQEWKDNYDQIDWSKKLDKPKGFRIKINGRYVDNDDE